MTTEQLAAESEKGTETEAVLPDAWLHDGEWARVGGLYIYPRDDGKFYIGELSGAHDYRDVDLPGFANMQAAIDHARWMVEENDVHRVLPRGLSR